MKSFRVGLMTNVRLAAAMLWLTAVDPAAAQLSNLLVGTFGSADEVIRIRQGYLVTGLGGNFSGNVARVSNAGALAWTNEVGALPPFGGEQFATNRLILAGRKDVSSSAGAVLVLNPVSGAVSRQWRYAGPAATNLLTLHDAAVATNGALVVGRVGAFGVAADLFIMKINGVGQPVWQKTLNNSAAFFSGSDRVRVDPTSDGKFVVHGAARPTALNAEDVLAFKIDADGQVDWLQTYQRSGQNNQDWALDFAETANGYLFLAASIKFVTGFGFIRDVTFLELNPASGALNLSYQIDSVTGGGVPIAAFPVALDHQPDLDTNLYVCGYGASFATNAHFFVVRFDPLSPFVLNA